MRRIVSTVLSIALLVSMVCIVASAEDTATPVTMFYQTTRSTNEFTELTRKWIADNLGIDMVVYPGSASEWQQQLSFYVTSDEVPDIVAYMDVNTFRSYAAEGLWYDLTDLLDDYPNIAEYVSSQTTDPDSVWARCSVDGKVYGIPYMAGLPCKNLNVVRKDWLDNLGLSVPTTLDEFTEVLRAFTYDDPDGNGIDDTYGYGTCSKTRYLTTFFGPFGATEREDTILHDDGKLYTNVISDEYKAGLKYLHELYAAGYISPDIFTKSETQMYEDWTRGSFGTVTWWWTNAGNAINRYGFFDENPNGEMAFFDPIVGPDGLSGHHAEDDLTYVVAISAKSEHVEEALKLLDFESTYYGYQTVYLGVEGQFFTADLDNNMLTWSWQVDNTDAYGNSINDMEYYKVLGNTSIQNQATLMLEDSDRNNILKEQVTRVYTAPVIRDVFVGLTTNEYAALSAETTKYYTDYMIKFVIGEKDIDEEWDSYVQGYLDVGGEAIRQSLLELYNANNGTNLVFGN